ncbi:prephenate dehydrogenase [Rhodoblastus acidophilus]|uniref:Prephenate dehydrogenase n=1 Tax=Candidatus Rhodoblastus alkanivorans TaxID=2954117 RepID=A0ABS9Z8U1_9HYPH|nr:prephenate dehydrogenase [Candidatus Rhodoblastus alkanivorans]MCI4684099.1 prephenate dehydrogenase [Candidatus Rhodoblastus alkanivorans]MDI4641419.1 prephenate dehydrogenase [Rhodoblastus acidophilus]
MSERQKRRPKARPRITIGLIGFGAFGRLVAAHLGPLFPIFVHDPACGADGQAAAKGVTLCDAATAGACDLVILAMPVPQLSAAIAAIRPHLRPGATVLDVCSVKALPAKIMRAELPDHVDIIGTHPMFGPQSARGGVKGLKIVVCPIRGPGARPLAAYLRKTFGLDAIIATPEEHDREAAMVQGLTHLIAKVLVEMEPLPRNMTTASFDLLLRAVDMVRYDAPEVFYAIERMNPFAPDVRRRFFALAAELAESLEKNGAA